MEVDRNWVKRPITGYAANRHTWDIVRRLFNGNIRVTLGSQGAEALQGQLAAFRKKFGRDPGPEDPVFFDPREDEPTPLSRETYDRELTAAAERMTESGEGDAAAYILAWRDLGYIVTEMNRHTFSAMEVAAYEDAVQHHRAERDDSPDEASELDDEDDDLDDEDAPTTPADLFASVADGLEQVVAIIIRHHDAEPARRLIEADVPADTSEDAAFSLNDVMFAVLLGWLVGAREVLNAEQAITALDWVYDLDREAGEQTKVISGAIGHPAGPSLTIREAGDQLGAPLFSALIWLAAGVVATAAHGEARWLRQFDAPVEGTVE